MCASVLYNLAFCRISTRSKPKYICQYIHYGIESYIFVRSFIVVVMLILSLSLPLSMLLDEILFPICASLVALYAANTIVALAAHFFPSFQAATMRRCCLRNFECIFIRRCYGYECAKIYNFPYLNACYGHMYSVHSFIILRGLS